MFLRDKRILVERATCHGYVCLYSCLDNFSSLIDPNQVETIVLPYRYEIFSDIETTNLSIELKEIESKMLDELSNLTSLDTCDFDKNTELLDSDNEIVVSLASSPSDTEDIKNVNCVTDDANAPSDTTCIPIKGEMAFRYASLTANSNSKESISNSILNLIEDGMIRDRFTTSKIVKLNYIHEEQEDGSNVLVTTAQPEYGGNYEETTYSTGSSNISIGISTGVVVALVVLGSVFFAKRKYKKSREASGEKNLLQKDLESNNHFMDDSDMCSDDQNYRNDGVVHNNIDDDEDDDDDDQGVMNPAKAKYDDGSFLQNRNVNLLSTISEVSEETDSSSLTNANNILKSPTSSSVSEPFSRILSDSLYSDGEYV